MEELVPTEVQKSRKLRSLVHTEETAVNPVADFYLESAYFVQFFSLLLLSNG